VDRYYQRALKGPCASIVK